MKKQSTHNSRAFDDVREVYWSLVKRGAPIPVRNYAEGMERLERMRRLRATRRAASAAAKAR